MIGNDLCFLSQEKSEKRLEQYLHKVTTENERKLLDRLETYLRMPFAWSIKEAAYKYFRRNKIIRLQPRKFFVREFKYCAGGICSTGQPLTSQGFSDFEHIESIVETAFGVLVGKTIITKEFIHSVLSDRKASLEQTFWGITKINAIDYSCQSAAVRENAINHLSKIYGEKMHFQFKKNSNHVPELFIDKVKSKNEFSFSHDQNYVGYAWRTPDDE